MTAQHALRCDCEACLPGYPATGTRVYQDARPLLAEATPDRLERARAASAAYRARHAERARAAAKDWNRRNPERRAAHNARSNREASLANFAERAAARLGAA